MEESEQRTVQVVRMGKLTIYEITSDELRQLEVGNPSSTLLNFSSSALALGVGIGATLLTGGAISSRVMSDLLMIIAVLSLAGGVILLVLWRRYSKLTTSVGATIRERGAATAAITQVSRATETRITESQP